MKQFKILLFSVLIALGAIFISVPGISYASNYYIYNPQWSGGTVSGQLGAYFTGDSIALHSDGSSCDYWSLMQYHLAYNLTHTQPSLDYVSPEFYENFVGRGCPTISLHTELAGKPAGNYVLSYPPGYSGYNSGTPSFCTFGWDGTTADISNCGHLSATITPGAPSNAATITDPTVNLTGTWVAVNPAIYADIRLYWKHTGNGVDTVSTGKIIPITTSGGSFSVPLSYFSFDYNGDWVLTSVADLKAPQLSDFIQTSDLTSPTGYHLNINFSTLTTPFTFSDWPTWYGTNSAGGYSAPSDFGNSFVGFFKPIFENAFAFANQVLKYFDATQAEARGQQLGSVFPITDAYLKKIDIFFGGFPLSAFFQFAIIVMLAIFVIRTIFKFIPFFG